MVHDLYAYALPRLAAIQNPQDVHFSESGSRVLGSAVAGAIRKALQDAGHTAKL